MTALARDADAEAIEGLPLTATADAGPTGWNIPARWRRTKARAATSSTLPIAGTAPRGTWRLDIHADPKAPPLASQTFLVEDFLPERIDFALSLPDGPIRLGDQRRADDRGEISLRRARRRPCGRGRGAVRGRRTGSTPSPATASAATTTPFSPVSDSLPSGERTDDQRQRSSCR